MNDLTYTYPAEVVIERAAENRRMFEELEQHRALVAVLWEMGADWAGQESDGSRDIDRQIRDGQELVLILAEHGFQGGAP